MTSRRQFLELAGLGLAGAAVSACDRPDHFASLFGRGTGTPPALEPWLGTGAGRAAAHALKRITYGPRPGDVARVAGPNSGSSCAPLSSCSAPMSASRRRAPS